MPTANPTSASPTTSASVSSTTAAAIDTTTLTTTDLEAETTSTPTPIVSDDSSEPSTLAELSLTTVKDIEAVPVTTQKAIEESLNEEAFEEDLLSVFVEEDRSISGTKIPIVVSRKTGSSETTESQVVEEEGVLPVVLSVIDSS